MISKRNPLAKILLAEHKLGKPLKRGYIPKRKKSPKAVLMNWYDDYISYIHSKRWLDKKHSLWLVRDHDCSICKQPLTEKASVLHHRTYKRLGREESGDLVFLCYNCHHKIHFYPDGRKKPIHPTALAKEEFWLRKQLNVTV